MQIRYLGGEKFEIRTGENRILLGEGLSIDSFKFPGPGEYEKAGISVVGVADDNNNTIYVMRVEEVNLCHLGKMANVLNQEKMKEIGDVDILFLPLGESGTLPTIKALDIASKIDPRILIPMLYSDLTEFKKGEGVDDGELPVLKIRRADLPEEERRIVILKPTV